MSEWSAWSVCQLFGLESKCGHGLQTRRRSPQNIPCLETGQPFSDSFDCQISCSSCTKENQGKKMKQRQGGKILTCFVDCNSWQFYAENPNWPISLHKIIGCSRGHNATMSTLSFFDVLSEKYNDTIEPDWLNLAREYVAAVLNLKNGCQLDSPNSMDSWLTTSHFLLQDCKGWKSGNHRQAKRLTQLLNVFNVRN